MSVNSSNQKHFDNFVYKSLFVLSLLILVLVFDNIFHRVLKCTFLTKYHSTKYAMDTAPKTYNLLPDYSDLEFINVSIYNSQQRVTAMERLHFSTCQEKLLSFKI